MLAIRSVGSVRPPCLEVFEEELPIERYPRQRQLTAVVTSETWVEDAEAKTVSVGSRTNLIVLPLVAAFVVVSLDARRILHSATCGTHGR